MARPEDLRSSMAEYIRNVHAAYFRIAATYPPAVQGGLVLLRNRFTVVAAGAHNLHVIATEQSLPVPKGPEVVWEQSQDGMEWSLRFLDPVVLPGLANAEQAKGSDPEAVRRVIGIGSHQYHLVVRPGSDLTGHHAGHAGTGLANAHLAAARDYEALRSYVGDPGLVDELAAADAAGLTRAHGLVACALAPGNESVRAASGSGDRQAVRQALLKAFKAGP